MTDEVIRGREARGLMVALEPYIEARREKIIREWELCEDVERRERLWQALAAWRVMVADLRRDVQTGVMTEMVHE